MYLPGAGPYAVPCGVPMDAVPLYVLTTLISAVVGVVLGYTLGLRSGRKELAQYKEGRAVEHEHRLAHERVRGGPCWVRGQLPPHADE